MEPIQTYEIPILHPLVVHFPIALTLLGTVAVLFWVARPTDFWYRCAVLIYLSGAVATILAYFTGEDAEHYAEDVPIVEEIVEFHEEMAIWTLAATLITLLTLVLIQPRALSGSVDERSPAIQIRIAVAVIAVAAAILVSWTSHLGGLMVWGVPR
jgi:uncharacterized membrane protein